MKTIKTIERKKYELHVQGRILKWTLPPEHIADRWEVIPSISLAHNDTMLSIRFAWICFELSFVILTFRVLEMIGEKV
uniref:hypothetical protein n=1 Tax=Candidatus Cryptobacteroides bacterium TaxID=3085639 RepID=UPI0040283C6B